MQHPHRQQRLLDLGERHLGVHVGRVNLVVAGDGIAQLVGKRVLHAAHRAMAACVGVLVVALGGEAGQVSHRERGQLVVVERLDGVHMLVGHLRRTVGRDARELRRALAPRVVHMGFRNLVFALAPGAYVARLEGALAAGRPVVEPERHVHALHMGDAVLRGEFLRKELLALVILGKRLLGGGLVQLERDDKVGLCGVHERAGRHGLVAAVGAFLDGGGGVGRQLRAARRAQVAAHAGALLLVPAGAREIRRDGAVGLGAHRHGGVDDVLGDYR